MGEDKMPDSKLGITFNPSKGVVDEFRRFIVPVSSRRIL
jgi:hypothetical protein